MILKLVCLQHWALGLYKVCINGDPGLTLTYFSIFTARSNLFPVCVMNGKNFYKVIKWGKLAANYQINKIYIFEKPLTPGDCLPPTLGVTYMCMTTIFKHLFPDDLETRHGPSRFTKCIIMMTWFDLDLFYSKFKFGQNCSLCFRPIVR